MHEVWAVLRAAVAVFLSDLNAQQLTMFFSMEITFVAYTSNTVWCGVARWCALNEPMGHAFTRFDESHPNGSNQKTEKETTSQFVQRSNVLKCIFLFVVTLNVPQTEHARTKKEWWREPNRPKFTHIFLRSVNRDKNLSRLRAASMIL